MAKEYERSADDRAFMVEFHREKVMQHWKSAVAEGVREPVILLLDLDDGFAMTVAAAAVGGFEEANKMYERVKSEHKGKDVSPTVILASERTTIKPILAQVQRHLHKTDSSNPEKSNSIECLDKPTPPDAFYLMAISGGKRLSMVPVSSSDKAGLTVSSAGRDGAMFVAEGQHKLKNVSLRN